MEKPSGVVLVVCSAASFVLSYTSTRIPALGTEESWNDISNLAPVRDCPLIQVCSLA